MEKRPDDFHSPKPRKAAGKTVVETVLAATVGAGMSLLSLLSGVAAQVGDLSFSLIKRQYGVKDYGRLFLDHGGVLDRFDSVLFVAPLVDFFVRIVMWWGW